MNVIERNISELIPAEYNPRYISDESLEHLKASIQRFDAVEPVLVNVHPDRKNIIISGHQRLKAAKSLGLETFPCVELELDKDKERELNIRMNKNTGTWDWDELATYFDSEELTDWGFTEEELFADGFEEELEAEEDDYEVPDEIHTDFVLGDLIEIGEHRLLCGDSTDSDQVAKLMDGEKADMVFTDPPYGMFLDADYSGMVNKDGIAGKKHSNVIGDHERYDPTHIFRDFPNVDEIVIFGADYFAEFIPNKNEGSWLVWDKRVEEKYDKVIGSAFELLWSKKKRKREVLRFEYSSWGARMEGATDTGKPHPTMKPVKMLSDVINKTDAVKIADLFLGSGSTMVACHQLNRKCYGMEIDPKYCQVIVDRMLKLDPSLEIKVNGKEYKNSLVTV